MTNRTFIHRCGLWVIVIFALVPASVRAQDQPAEPSHSTRPDFTPEQLEFFERQVRPILVQRCYECHDPANAEPGGGLSLASRADILAGGDSGPAIDTSDPLGSLLIEAVRHGPRFQMPPDEKIPTEEVAILLKWIEQKAPWPADSDQRSQHAEVFDLEQRRQSHWAWAVPTRSALPEVADAGWPNHAIDRFILQKLDSAALRPTPAATGTTWLRRVHLDITGLPPTADEAKSFATAWEAALQVDAGQSSGQSPGQSSGESPAIRSLKQATVDRLLESSAFGEHWARHWLDLVRYAETCGHEFDFPLPGAFEYRDYVIRALNQDVPYDQWIREHLAGDLLAQPRRHPESGFNESILGTAFWYFNEATHAPVDVRVDQANRVDNQIDVFGKTFLGLTVACARCHDHKFDAISARDYYALFGIVKSIRRDVGVIDVDQAQEKFVQQCSNLQEQANQIAEQEWDTIRRWILDSESDFMASLERCFSDSVARESGQWPATFASHPLHLLNSLGRREVDQSLSQWWQAYRAKTLSQKDAAAKFQASAYRLADFSGADRQQWWASGWAFALGESSGRWQFPASGDWRPSNRWNLRTHEAWDSSQWAKTLSGTLRSPTFRLDADRIHLFARGENAKVRLIVNGYQMHIHQDLLFSQTIVSINSPEFTWLTMHGDLSKYVGHEVYLELIDGGEGDVAVAEIWQGGENPTLMPHPALVRLCESLEQVEHGKSLAAPLAEAIRAALRDDSISSDEEQKWRELAYSLGCRLDPTSADLDLGTTNSQWSRLSEQAAANTVPAVASRLVYVAAPWAGDDQVLYIRGNSKNQGDVVPRGNLEALEQILAATPAASGLDAATSSDPAHDPSGRLNFAEAIASPHNPLTARVMVNRVWLHLFGEGLVPTPDDFGFNGTAPTHPELLDYLALEFVEQGWSIKRLIREIVLSRTYGQATASDPVAQEKDPANTLYHSARVRRLSGETLRDAMLQVSGRIDRKMYGPSVPTYVSDLMQGRGRPNSGPLDGQGRRSIYLEVRRNFLNPWMLVFDTPAPFSTMGKRSRSNVPAQALALLNDPLVHELADSWARKIVDWSATDVERLQLMYWSALARPMNPEEQQVMLDFLESRRTSLNDELEAWTQIAHAMFNLKEFAFVN
ncbi:MAG: PSD1 domain-containing protein [Planctomycetaceae bacterium]|nr:PSD1 domain-containing protein [Planctomycetaceae bacterium]